MDKSTTSYMSIKFRMMKTVILGLILIEQTVGQSSGDVTVPDDYMVEEYVAKIEATCGLRVSIAVAELFRLKSEYYTVRDTHAFCEALESFRATTSSSIATETTTSSGYVVSHWAGDLLTIALIVVGIVLGAVFFSCICGHG